MGGGGCWAVLAAVPPKDIEEGKRNCPVGQGTSTRSEQPILAGGAPQGTSTRSEQDILLKTFRKMKVFPFPLETRGNP